MEAIKFETHIVDGVIRVPDLYRSRLAGSVRIICCRKAETLKART